MSENPGGLDWEAGIPQFIAEGVRYFSSAMVWRMKEIIKLQRKQNSIAGKFPNSILLKGGNAYYLKYWYKIEQLRREEMRKFGRCILTLRRPDTPAKVMALKGALEMAGFKDITWNGATLNGKRCSLKVTAQVKGLQMYVWQSWRTIMDVTYYTNLRVKNKTLDLLLD